MVRRSLFVLLTVWLMAGPGLAQTSNADDKVSVRLSQSRIGMTETATLTISVSGLSSDVRLSEPASRNGALQFNHIGQRFSMTSINGVSNTATEYDYEVVPLQPGRHIIEPISGTVSGVPFQTEPIRLEVTNTAPQTSNPYSAQPYNPWQRRQRIRGMFDDLQNREQPDDVILEAELEPETVYQHQASTYTLRLMAAVRLASDPRYHPIAPTGLLSVPLEQKNRTEVRNGRGYAVNEVSTLFFPLTEGEYEFPSTQVRVRTTPFGPLKNLVTQPHTLKVVPLPTQGRPRSFTGAVGEQFEITAYLSENEVVAGQTVQLTVNVKGDGHLDLVPYPYLPEWEGMEKKQGTSPSSTRVENGKVVSQRTYNFRLKPTEPGEYDFSDVALAFFRPSQERYEVLKAAPMTLKVTPGGEVLKEGAGELARELEEADRPMTEPGPTAARSPHLPWSTLALAVALSILAASLHLFSPGRRWRLPGWKGNAGRFRLRFGSKQELVESLSEFAPGSDRLSRRRHLLEAGWQEAQIERFEELRSQANRSLYGKGSGAEIPADLRTQLKALLQEVPR